MDKKSRKQSIVAGALTGSAGIFVTKALSLLYVIPFNEIAKEATVFYSYAYTVYDAVLQVCLSGLPFAIATLVAKYATKDDYATVRLVKKVSRSIITVIGLISCILLITFAKPLAYMIVPTDLQSTDYIRNTQNVLTIVAFALVFVPYLSYYRGFYQGLKEFKTYSITQVLEQVVRIAFLISASSICVYALNLNRVWAAYMGVASTSISAIFTIIYFMTFEKKYELTHEQVDTRSEYSNKDIVIELFKVSIPYLLNSLMISTSALFVLLYFASGLEAYGTSAKLITIYQGIINYQSSKLASIPMIIMTGFCLAIIPHITEAVTNNDDKKVVDLVHKIMETVNFLSVPICFFMLFFAKEIYYIMYGNYYLDIGTNMLSKTIVNQFLMNFFGITISTLIALQLRKTYLILETSRLVFMLALYKIFLVNFGVNGYFIIKATEYVLYVIAGLFIIKSKYGINFKKMLDSFTKSWMGAIPMFIIAAIYVQFEVNVGAMNRFVVLVLTGLMFLICIGVYIVITYKLNVITELFNITISKETLVNLKNKLFKKEERI
ncbi:MAG TPA: oligosaccharide flippase family protein [Erysipelotrichaceae bacterium]|nr:oligosaccharide flippase family protein [Erysipelotrichia bacterium]HPX33260.1 oligosaccharide flippase family protein [Erysipelotrichaceae bacterium]HQA85665.1 oligosaccharide flippase family protein [Erysipelotrichaceae bacterium]